MRRTTPTTLLIERRPPPSANSILRMGWRKRHTLALSWQAEAMAAWTNAGRPEYVRPRVTIRAYYRGDRIPQDQDNGAFGVAKFILDGLKGRAFTDDSREVIGQPLVEILKDNANERVEIVLEETA